MYENVLAPYKASCGYNRFFCKYKSDIQYQKFGISVIWFVNKSIEFYWILTTSGSSYDFYKAAVVQMNPILVGIDNWLDLLRR